MLRPKKSALAFRPEWLVFINGSEEKFLTPFGDFLETRAVIYRPAV
jgi:hypothetical protein